MCSAAVPSHAELGTKSVKVSSGLPTQKQAVGSGWGLGVSLINVHIQYTCSPVGFLDFTVWAGRILMHIQYLRFATES